MKILLSAYSCEPGKGSEPGNGWNWAMTMAKHVDELWVLTSSKSKEKIDSFLKANPVNNLHLVYVDLPLKFSQWLPRELIIAFHYYIWQWKAYKIARKLDQKLDFDVIHHVTWGSLKGGSWLWKLKKPFIFGPIGGGQTFPPLFKRYFGEKWIKEQFRTLLTTKLIFLNIPAIQSIKKASLILATNRDTEFLCKCLGAKHVELFLDTALPIEYIPKTPPHRLKDKVFKVLWVGRLLPIKGLKLALEAISKVDKALPIKLIIVGGGPLDRKVDQWIKELNLQEKIECKGQVSWETVKQYYSTCDIFLFTSLRDSFGSQVLEAMAHALPVITLNHHGVRDFVPETAGVKINVSTPEQVVKELAEAIEYMYWNEEERFTKGLSGWKFVKEHTWEINGKRMVNYYKKIKQFVYK